MKKDLTVRVCCLFALVLCLMASPLSVGEAPAESLDFTVSNTDWKPYFGRAATIRGAEDVTVAACGGTDFCREQLEIVPSRC